MLWGIFEKNDTEDKIQKLEKRIVLIEELHQKANKQDQEYDKIIDNFVK